MKKNLIFAPLALIALGLVSCNKNTYTVTDKQHITFSVDGTTYDSYGYMHLNIKKDTVYTFIYDLSKCPLKHNMDETKEGALVGFCYDFSIDRNNSSVKLNNKLLTPHKEELSDEDDYDYTYNPLIEDMNGIVFTERVTLTNKDKVSLTLKASVDYTDATICSVYAS